MKRNNAWSIRCLVDELFVPSSQRIILKIVRFIMLCSIYIKLSCRKNSNFQQLTAVVDSLNYNSSLLRRNKRKLAFNKLKFFILFYAWYSELTLVGVSKTCLLSQRHRSKPFQQIKLHPQTIHMVNLNNLNYSIFSIWYELAYHLHISMKVYKVFYQEFQPEFQSYLFQSFKNIYP